ncbi:MAG: PQQ-like beta-propeller repeat protein [Planctomycetes bacterium]|nr:PQQ-like beta-propeller repeat protein [Planctomycetota bacterium]
MKRSTFLSASMMALASSGAAIGLTFGILAIATTASAFAGRQAGFARAGEERLDANDQWPQFRGPLGTGAAPRGDPPISWSEDENVRWKTPIPGQGHSSPIVWGDRVFVTTAVPYGDVLPKEHPDASGAHDNVPSSRHLEFVVIAINRRDGAVLWRRTVHRQRPHESTHESGTWASHSPVTDGERLFAYFGSYGLYCLDMNGEPLWQTDMGTMHPKHGHGEGSSPALYGETVVINWDHEGDSFVIAFDARTGDQRWKVRRREGTSWSTPLIVEHEGKPQVIISATHRVRGYDLASGNVIWECGGLSGNVVASPVAADGVVYVTNSYETREMLAIRLSGAKGDITATDAVVWTRHRDTPYVPSPVLHDGRLYFLKHYQGFLTCVSAETGRTIFGPVRLAGVGNVYASLVAAGDRVYVTGRNGTTAVVKHGGEFELLALNRLDGSFSATPAIVGSEMFSRSERFLYCISAKPVD